MKKIGIYIAIKGWFLWIGSLKGHNYSDKIVIRGRFHYSTAKFELWHASRVRRQISSIKAMPHPSHICGSLAFPNAFVFTAKSKRQ